MAERIRFSVTLSGEFECLPDDHADEVAGYYLSNPYDLLDFTFGSSIDHVTVEVVDER